MLSCELSRASALVFWSHNGRPVQECQGLELHAEGPRRTLCIQAADLAHAGLYTCQSGTAPGAPSLSFTVQVAGKYGPSRKPERVAPPDPYELPRLSSMPCPSLTRLSQHLASHCPPRSPRASPPPSDPQL